MLSDKSFQTYIYIKTVYLFRPDICWRFHLSYQIYVDG